MPYADLIKRKEFQKEYRLKNKEKLKKYHKEWSLENKEVIKEKAKIYFQENKKHIIEKRREYKKIYRGKRRKTDVLFVLVENMRSRIRNVLVRNKKSSTTIKLLGCTKEEFKKHIESKFTKEMSWDKLHLIHIDHIRPCASFDLSDPGQQNICFHYTNLQPLWAIDNIKKGAKVN